MKTIILGKTVVLFFLSVSLVYCAFVANKRPILSIVTDASYEGPMAYGPEHLGNKNQKQTGCYYAAAAL